MILGKQLIDNGQTHDAKGLRIDPGAPYEQSIEGDWHRAGLLPRVRLLSRKRSVGAVGEAGVQDTDRGETDQA